MSFCDEHNEVTHACDPMLKLAADMAGPCLERLAEHNVLSLREPGSLGWKATIHGHGEKCTIEIEAAAADELFAIVRALRDVATMSWLDCPTGCLSKVRPGDALCAACLAETENDRARGDHERERGRNATEDPRVL